MATPVTITSSSGGGNAGQLKTNPANPATSSAASNAASTRTAAAATDKTAEMSPVAKAKAQLNASIVEASLTVSLKSANDPMSVVFKTALTGINEALEADFGKDAIQTAASQDNSPEATANRIVSLSTAFYEAYKQQNPGQDPDTTLNNFMDTVKKGMEQGFKEARGMLEGFKVLTGELSSNIDKTYDLVQQGFADFAAARKAPPAENASATITGAAAAWVNVNAGASATIAPKAADDGVGRLPIDPKAV